MTKGKAPFYALFVVLGGLELALAAYLQHTFELSLLQWAMLAFAVFRLSRLCAFDGVMQPFRAPFVTVVAHDSGAGDTTSPRTDRGPFVEVVGELICCPICNGTHITTILFLVFAVAPGFAQLFVGAMAVMGLREFLEPIFETAQWAGEYARHANGKQHRERALPPVRREHGTHSVDQSNGRAVHFAEWDGYFEAKQ